MATKELRLTRNTRRKKDDVKLQGIEFHRVKLSTLSLPSFIPSLLPSLRPSYLPSFLSSFLGNFLFLRIVCVSVFLHPVITLSFCNTHSCCSCKKKTKRNKKKTASINLHQFCVHLWCYQCEHTVALIQPSHCASSSL